uniref:Uncharacterized protein n=1 Tax=Salarias fasciatus TaxID=181472 RepID=A0A672GGW7_SALFA
KLSLSSCDLISTKRLQDQKRSQHRINLGAAFTRWRALRDRLGITLDQQLAVLLLDSCSAGRGCKGQYGIRRSCRSHCR